MMRPPTPRLRRGLRHLFFALGALQGVYLINALYARGPSTLTELSPVIALVFFGRRRGELGAFASASAGVATVVSCTLSVQRCRQELNLGTVTSPTASPNQIRSPVRSTAADSRISS